MPNNHLSTFVLCTSCFFAHASIPTKSLCLCKLLFCFLPPCTCPRPPPRSSLQASTFIHLLLTHCSPSDHFLRVFHQRAAWLVLHLFSRPSLSLGSFPLTLSPFYLGTYVQVPPTPVPFAWLPPAWNLHSLFFIPECPPISHPHPQCSSI